MKRPAISLIIATAREANGLRDRPDQHILQDAFDTLNAQTYRDFEVVIVDSIAPYRDLTTELACLGRWTFPWRVVPFSSWWLEEGLWSLQGAFNAGAVASLGYHLSFCGDCCSFPVDYLERAASYIMRGYEPHALCFVRMDGYLVQKDFTPLKPHRTIDDLKAAGLYRHDAFLSDTRFDIISQRGMVPHTPDLASWQWFYGYGFVSRADFFYVNGWDENFDGEKSLGDVELGSRLEMAGRHKMYLDADFYCYEEWHHHCSRKRMRECQAVRSNYDLIYLMRDRGIWKANSTVYTEDECWSAIRCERLKTPGWPEYRNDDTNPNLHVHRHWIENQAVFTLKDPLA